ACALSAGLLALTLAACAPKVEVFSYQYDSKLDEVFIKKDVDFSVYEAVIVDQIEVWYPTEAEPSPENRARAEANLERARSLFREAINDALDDRYRVVESAGPGVLRLTAEFVDLRSVPAGGAVPAELERFEFRTEPGHVTMVARLLDARSGETLARAADLGKRASVGGDGKVDWDAVRYDFDYWAEVFAEWMDRVHPEI
ncbi:MAG: DUF3313 family protein, partial [Pseudomonadota bacterium]